MEGQETECRSIAGL